MATFNHLSEDRVLVLGTDFWFAARLILHLDVLGDTLSIDND
jgi:hypothetical protein